MAKIHLFAFEKQLLCSKKKEGEKNSSLCTDPNNLLIVCSCSTAIAAHSCTVDTNSSERLLKETTFSKWNISSILLGSINFSKLFWMDLSVIFLLSVLYFVMLVFNKLEKIS